MSLRARIERDFSTPRVTMLGAGPMSTRVTDAVIQLANFYRKPVALIPSRRQVDSSDLGGGYVNNWSTEQFSRYVRDRDTGGFVFLARDHSGPWQLNREVDGSPISHATAMDEVKESLRVDIQAGFDFIHIDPSPGLSMGRSSEQVEDDVIELMRFCQEREIRQIEYEIGADEQSPVPEFVGDAELTLSRLLSRLKKEGLRSPVFYVLQTGTKVMETRNIGSFDSQLPVVGMLPSMVQLPAMISMCQKYGVLLKEHNADYLSDEALSWHRRFGISAANVAPEFGVVETREIIAIAEEINHETFLSAFSSVVLAGKKWEKWLVEGSTAGDRQKVEIAGHYHFSDPNLQDEFQSLAQLAEQKSIAFEPRVSEKVSVSIDRYLRAFGYQGKSK